MKSTESLTANKWYPLQNGKPLYPTPQSILRAAVGAEDYKFISETVTTEHIRAAVIMPLENAFQHLLTAVPWGMAYTCAEWRMLIVSTLDPVRWLDLARMSGAKAWLKGHNLTYTYNWQLPETDEHGLKRRPPNALGATAPPAVLSEPKYQKSRSHLGRQIKAYDKPAIIEALKRGILKHQQIADAHGISRITVLKIAQQNGLSKGGVYVKN